MPGADVVEQVLAEGSEVTSCAVHTHLALHIPHGATPGFMCPVVSFQWTLKLELIIEAEEEVSKRRLMRALARCWRLHYFCFHADSVRLPLLVRKL